MLLAGGNCSFAPKRSAGSRETWLPISPTPTSLGEGEGRLVGCLPLSCVFLAAELAQKARKEIADYLAAGKDERARIRVEHIIREDYLVEAMEILELYCDLLLARFGLIQSMK